MTRQSPSIIRTGGDADLAFAVVVLASYFATFSALRAASVHEIVYLIGLGTAYLTLGIYGYAYCAHSKSIFYQILYFSVQIPLGALIVYLGRGAGFNAMVLLPLAGHAVVLLPKGFGYVTQFLIALAYVLAVYTFSGSMPFVWEGFPSFIAGLIFIVVFTQMALNEEASRREVERLVTELTTVNQRLREYSFAVEDLAITKERNRLAREIHDGLGHYLTTIHMQIQAAGAIQAIDPGRAAEILSKAQELTQDALSDVRQSVSALHQKPDHRASLPDQIEKLFDNAKSFGVEPQIQVVGIARELSLPAYWTLFRAVQEGISNTCKHAQAKHLWIVLEYLDEGKVRLSITDDGIGIGGEVREGFGMMGLRERIKHLDGDFSIQTQNGKGFSFEVVLPI